MKIQLTTVMVDNQEVALAFYVGKLAFTKKHDIALGPFRWLTVTSPDGIDGVELLLEPMDFAPARVYQKAMFDAGIPAAAFFTDDIDAEVARLKKAGVAFRGEPRDMGPVIAVTFDDTCGNLINLVEPQ
jgi:predicted enzyme related to lactoylglutathione lyase